MVGWLYDGLIAWLAEQVQGMLAGLLAVLTASVFTSPDVTVFPQVQQLAGQALAVVNAVYVLAVVAAGIIAMGHGTFQIQYQVKDLLPRLVFGLLAANFGADICSALIEIANALTAALVGEAASGPRVIRFVQGRIVAVMADPAAGLLAAVLGALIVVLLYLLLVGWFVRLAVLIVLAGIAPIALACYALPYTQPAASLWWRALLGCLATPLLQAAFFSVGIDLLLGPAHIVPDLLGIDPDPAGFEVANLFFAVCVLAVTVRIPKLVGRYVTHTGQASTAGVLLRAVAVQAVTRRLRLPGKP